MNSDAEDLMMEQLEGNFVASFPQNRKLSDPLVNGYKQKIYGWEPKEFWNMILLTLLCKQRSVCNCVLICDVM